MFEKKMLWYPSISNPNQGYFNANLILTKAKIKTSHLYINSSNEMSATELNLNAYYVPGIFASTGAFLRK